MKPIVVSAAAAGRAPSAEPKVSAALPCNKCRREILPKSIACSPVGGSAAGYRAAAPARRGLGSDVAMFVPFATHTSMFTYTNEIVRRFRFSRLHRNLAQAPRRLNDRHSSHIVCSLSPAFVSRRQTWEISLRRVQAFGGGQKQSAPPDSMIRRGT